MIQENFTGKRRRATQAKGLETLDPKAEAEGLLESPKETLPPSSKRDQCHTRFSVENRMHLICVPGSQFHTYDRLMSVISQDTAQNVQKKFINFYYTHDG
jgi:hypothetical protein